MAPRIAFGGKATKGDPSWYDSSGKLHIDNPVSEMIQGLGTFFSQMGRPASAQQGPSTNLLLQGDPTGRYIPRGMQQTFAPSAPVLPAPITSPNTTFQHADDEYNRLKSQYGGPSGVEQLAMQTSLPVGFTPTGAKGPASLKDFYSAESQVGRRDIESIIPSLTQGLQGKEAENIAAWAKANPMLAQREYAKKFSADQAAAGYGGTGPSDEAIRAAISGGKFFPSAGSPSPIENPPEFGRPANTVPAPPAQQGAAIMAPMAPAQDQAAGNTAGAQGMPQLPTTPESQAPGKNFLRQVLSSPWGQATMNTLGAIGTDYLQGIR